MVGSAPPVGRRPVPRHRGTEQVERRASGDREAGPGRLERHLDRPRGGEGSHHVLRDRVDHLAVPHVQAGGRVLDVHTEAADDAGRRVDVHAAAVDAERVQLERSGLVVVPVGDGGVGTELFTAAVRRCTQSDVQRYSCARPKRAPWRSERVVVRFAGRCCSTLTSGFVACLGPSAGAAN